MTMEKRTCLIIRNTSYKFRGQPVASVLIRRTNNTRAGIFIAIVVLLPPRTFYAIFTGMAIAKTLIKSDTQER